MQATEVRPATPTSNEQNLPDFYDQMCKEIYAYMFGQISFLQLLDRIEEVLGIEPPQPSTTTSRQEDG